MLKNRLALSLLFSEMADGEFIEITVFGRVGYVVIRRRPTVHEMHEN
jgi:hypothetical protein